LTLDGGVILVRFLYLKWQQLWLLHLLVK
jgi:hypothetical protein